jgi:hypothetical protein
MKFTGLLIDGSLASCKLFDEVPTTTEGKITRLEFQYRPTENLILEYHRTEVRQNLKDCPICS